MAEPGEEDHEEELTVADDGNERNGTDLVRPGSQVLAAEEESNNDGSPEEVARGHTTEKSECSPTKRGNDHPADECDALATDKRPEEYGTHALVIDERRFPDNEEGEIERGIADEKENSFWTKNMAVPKREK